MTDWKIFRGDGSQHDGLLQLPEPPPWRFGRPVNPLQRPSDDALNLQAELSRAAPFRPTDEMVLAVNAALYLRRPLLISGKAGAGKSTLIAKVAYELKLGRVLRWPISSRATVASGIYDYDAVGRLQASKGEAPPVQDYLTLGPLGTALLATSWPRALLIDEIDKSDLDFANDLLNVIEEGEYTIPELRRLGDPTSSVRDADGRLVQIQRGHLECNQFPFVVMTSNAEREFPGPFLRRCVRLNIDLPDATQLPGIVSSHLAHYAAQMNATDIQTLIDKFDASRKSASDVATDQLLNAIFLTVAMRDARERTFSPKELTDLRSSLMRPLSGPGA
jgi:MoxR-like ATPase